MAWLVRNWHLKLSAVALATVLYTGIVFSTTFTDSTFRGVPVQPVEVPPNTFLMSDLPTIDVHYRVDRAGVGQVNADTFAATVDLSRYDLEHPGERQSLPVVVRSLSDSVSVRDYEPRTITVVLDTVERRTVPVVVETGEVPEGLEISDPVLSAREVEVVGPRSQVLQVDRAVARAHISPSGIDFWRTVDLEPVGLDGQRILNVDADPPAIEVRIPVRAVETTRTVPVRPDLTGTPGTGFAVGAVTVEPSVVTLRGQPSVLEGVVEVVTEALSLDGATESQTFEAALVLPDGTQLADEDGTATITVSVTISGVPSSRTYVIGLVCQGIPAGHGCLPQIDQLAVTLGGTPGALDAVSAANLIAVLDVSGLSAGTHQVTPGLTPPSGTDLVSVSPNSVGVQLVPSATPAPTPEPTPEP